MVMNRDERARDTNATKVSLAMSYCHATKKLTVTGLDEKQVYAMAQALMMSPRMSEDFEPLVTFITKQVVKC